MPPFDRSWTNPRIHSYAASFGEDLARELIVESTNEGDTILDPFVGAGTTALEAVLANRHSVGIDVDPIACRISELLTSRVNVPYFLQAMDSLHIRLRDLKLQLIAKPQLYNDLRPGDAFEIGNVRFKVPSEPAIEYWFAPSHMATLAVIRETALSEPDPVVRRAFEVAISSVIIRKWPNTLSYAMDIDHSRPHRPRCLQAQPIEDQFSLFDRVLNRTKNVVLNIQEALSHVECSATIMEGDSVQRLVELDGNFVGFVLTSPPYLNAIDYPRAHKFSHWWLCPDKPPLSRSEYLGLRRSSPDDSDVDCLLVIPALYHSLESFRDKSIYRNISRYVLDLAAVLDQLYRVLKQKGTISLIVANNVIAGDIFPVSTIIGDLLKRSGFLSVEVIRRTIKSSRRRYPFGKNGFSGPMREEFLITGIK